MSEYDWMQDHPESAPWYQGPLLAIVALLVIFLPIALVCR